MAVRVRAKVIQIVREEMDAIGAQEMLLPALHPAEPWRRSGRWELMGQEMFRLRDRRGAEHALGMTHEEIFATVARELSSYRQLPQQWYQFQTKFRDEPRPKGGLMRTREFTMKDAYSFDIDRAGLDASFDAYHGAYVRIFERLGIPALPCEASSGTMGGSGSTEFMCPAEVGEDLVVHSPGAGTRRTSNGPCPCCRPPRTGRAFPRPSVSTRPASAPSRICWRTTLPPTGRSRRSSTSWTGRSRWSCSAATIR